MAKNYYLTTTLPYVNAEPHIGFAMEIVTADVISRFHRLSGDRVIFNTGTDEHGQKIYQNALEAGKTPQEYVDHYAATFDQLKQLLHLSYDRFIRTTNPDHKLAAQEFWRRCLQRGDIYKKLYKIKYCVGCELEKTDSELVDNRCPLHPNRELEIRSEENYFFKFSKYQQPLLNYYEKNPGFIQPESKMREIVSFVSQGLQDFSISRLKEKMPWGVSVPDDDDHVMYVWFDALINYISTLGWPKQHSDFNNFWPGVQIAGKDNLRQQSAMWQAMLLSAQIPPSKKILINGFISVDGQKMSKSLGNVINPAELVKRYGLDGARFLLTFIGPINDDIDVTFEKLDAYYTAHLSNGLGNLISRVASLCHRSGFEFTVDKVDNFRTQISQALENYQLSTALESIWKRISEVDHIIDEKQPWKLQGAELRAVLQTLVAHLKQIGYELQPFMPTTAQTILDHFGRSQIQAINPLFPRLNT